MIKKIQYKLSKDANLKELLSGSAVTFVIKIVGMLLGYLVMIYISRKFGAEGAGLYTLTTNVLNFVAVIGGVGLHTAVLRYVGQMNNSLLGMKLLYRYILQIVFPITILLGILLFSFAEIIALELLGNELYMPAFKIGGIVLPLFTINLIQIEYIRGLKKLRISEYLRSINRPVLIIILLIIMATNYGSMAAIYAFIASIIVSFIISSIYIHQRLKNKNSIETQKQIVMPRFELVKTSLPMMVTSIATFIIGSAGAIFLERYADTDKVGVFNVCLRLAQLVSFVLVVVNTISGPKFAELFWADKRQELQKLIQQSSKLIFFVSLTIAIGLIGFSKFILGLFGEEFIIGSKTLVVLIIGQIINASTGSIGILLNMSGHQKGLRNIMMVTALLVVTSYLIFVPIYGMLGTAIISVVGSFCINISSVVYAKYKLDLNTFYLPFTKP